MSLTTTQISLCFQAYWSMWLENALGGLLFMGVHIGIAAFFLKKFIMKKAINYQPTSGTANRPFSPSEIHTIDDTNQDQMQRKPGSRGSSPRSDNSGSPEYMDDFANATLEQVNNVRVKYNVSPVNLSDQLSTIAQRWANHMAQTGKLEHSPAEMRSFGRQILGENYVSTFQTELTASKMVKKWMKERFSYQFGSNGRRETENFTQLIWRATQDIGVGRARSADGNWWYGVVVFDPPGNIANQYANNVPFIT
ncbi:unnamed protein product [Adineta steineri]|uniref:SCP domain-containing protein n=1 Tax=Adineta steineri TaxID=433720 RepID=A0A815ML70_9BILA|nr:unnamed protein product [Adineta steineri]CAF3761143.1 unnamed protein product [Adineta steineri]